MNNLSTKHRILITNDDGIDAPGIKLLESIATEFSGDIWVVAPASERSGASHSISLTDPLRMHQLGPKRFEIVGSPTDCILMAMWHIMTDGPPTLILSGVNSGGNLGEEVSYSGTIAAAMEGTLEGIRSISISQTRQVGTVADFAPTARFAPDLLRRCIELEQWPEGSFININFPNCPVDEVGQVRVTHQGQRPGGRLSIDARHDARNQPYFWVKITHPRTEHELGCDLAAIDNKDISVTPIKMDFTDYGWQRALGGVLS